MVFKITSKTKQTEVGKIPEYWDVKRLKDISLDVSYGYTASASEEPVGPKFLRITDIVPYFVDWEKVPFCRISDNKKDKYSLGVGDIVVARTGANTGASSIIKIQKDCVFASYLIRFRINSKVAIPIFVGYVLKSHLWENYIEGILGGSAQPGANAKQLGQFKLPIPPVQEQKNIAKILSALDSKIELNRCMNGTLEAVGEAVFRRWFVDFEFPNEEGKPYNSSGGKMVYNDELEKEIPKGWRVNPIDEIADFLNGLAMQKFPAKENEEFLPVIKIRELRQGITESTDRANLDVPEEYVVDDGAVLFSWSGSLEVVLWGYGKGALNQHLFKVTSSEYPKWFFYYWILNYLPEYRHIASGKATTMGHIRRHHLTNSLVVVPDEKTLKRMDKMFAPVIKKIIAKKIETRTLTQIRDSLLPKLMSGKIRVPITNDSVEVL